jgi:hypothetical protein
MTNELTYIPEAERIAQEFPGWRAWSSLRGGQWHARLNNDRGDALMLIHDDNPEGIRQQIVALHRQSLLPRQG